jgi:F0F1-type ATP synthase membrane subunit b/b'
LRIRATPAAVFRGGASALRGPGAVVVGAPFGSADACALRAPAPARIVATTCRAPAAVSRASELTVTNWNAIRAPMTERTRDLRADAAGTASAIERVLRAERDAEAELVQRRQEAARRVESARAEALAIVNRALERAARWRERHAGALARRVATLRSRAAVAPVPAAVDEAAISAAIARVAARLTGAEGDQPRKQQPSLPRRERGGGEG